MKILVDTCVWSLLLRRRNKNVLSPKEQQLRNALSEAIRSGQVAIIGPIRQEILSGIKDPSQFAKLRTALGGFHDEPLESFHYEEAARLFNLCRRLDVECGPIDILICAIAAQRQWSILTIDQGLTRCIQALRSEGLRL